LTCSDFDLKGNYINQGSLKNKAFKNADVPHYRNPQRKPIQALNDILNNCYEAPKLKTPFLVQVLIPKYGASQINDMMTTLKENSKWISTNKRNSAEKTITKRLSEELAIIMEFSTPKERSTFQPKLHTKFKYQVDMDSNKFCKKYKKTDAKMELQFAEMLRSKIYMDYIKDPFNKETTMKYLKETLPQNKVPGLKSSIQRSLPPYGISYKNITFAIGSLKKQVRNIDARHYNAYLIVPRLVYHMSLKLRNEFIDNILGKDEEVRFIQYITRYGLYTRANPYCKLHGAYAKYTKIHNVTYINNCDDWNRIIPVTMFLVMLFNVCFMYHTNPRNNLLLTALTGFDYGKSITNDTFMNTLSKFSHTHQIIQSKNYLYFLDHIDALSFYIYDTGFVLATSICKMTFWERNTR
jgi:hypothetical protein